MEEENILGTINVSSVSNNDTSIMSNNDTGKGSKNGENIAEAKGKPKKNYDMNRKFKPEWMKNPKFSSWLDICPEDDVKCYCKFCKKTFKGRRKEDLARHAATTKHRKREADAYFSDTGDLFADEDPKEEGGFTGDADSSGIIDNDCKTFIKSENKFGPVTLRASKVFSDSCWPKIVLFGDSITQYCFSPGGWGALLADEFQRRADIVNRGFNGYTTRYTRHVLTRLYPDKSSLSDIIAFVIFLGAYDSNYEEQQVTAKDYHDYLVRMIVYLTNTGLDKGRIILIGPPACDTNAWTESCRDRGIPKSKDNGMICDYNDKCMRAAAKCDVAFVNLFTAMLDSEDWRSLLSDGLHLSAAGSKFLYNLLQPYITRLTTSLIPILPDWHDLDSFTLSNQ